jgi:3-isopropylmalate dehydrogenase
MLVDNAAMQLVLTPGQFDVLRWRTPSATSSPTSPRRSPAGRLAASASLGDGGPGIYEPVHGSAPDIAGTGKANPTAMLRSVALLLEHGLGRPEEARALDAAVDQALETTPTPDLGGSATTGEFSDAVLASA